MNQDSRLFAHSDAWKSILRRVYMNKRLIRVGVKIKDRFVYYSSEDGFNVSVLGAKYTTPTQDECTVKLVNLNSDNRSWLLDSNNERFIQVELGRMEGDEPNWFTVYEGDVVDCAITNPPDINLILEANTKSFQSYRLVSKSIGATTLSTICKQAADDLKCNLQFNTKDFSIRNYYYTGSALSQLIKIETLAEVSAYIDGNTMVVQDKNTPRGGKQLIQILNIDTGMAGIPSITPEGIEVEYLINKESVIGSLLRIESKLNPVANGDYIINQLEFSAESHGDTFHYSALCYRII